jgi:hypothetical protein
VRLKAPRQAGAAGIEKKAEPEIALSAGPAIAPTYVRVARLRRLRGDRGLEFPVNVPDKRVSSRSIRITGRMTTLAEPACTGG